MPCLSLVTSLLHIRSTLEFETRVIVVPSHTDVAQWVLELHTHAVKAEELMPYLGDVASGCVVACKGIQKLGFNSPLILRDFFAQYGQVASVVLIRSRVRTRGGRRNRRPEPIIRRSVGPQCSSMAFVSMTHGMRTLFDSRVLVWVGGACFAAQVFNSVTPEHADDSSDTDANAAFENTYDFTFMAKQCSQARAGMTCRQTPRLSMGFASTCISR